jgi:hypothetical protein
MRSASSGLVGQHVADSADRVYQGDAEATIDLIAQVIDMDIDGVGAGVEVDVPNVLDEHGTGNGTVRVAKEKLEHGEFFRRDIDGQASALDGASGGIEREVRNGELRGFADSATKENTDAGGEFGEREWLDEIIVGTQIEAGYTVFDARFGGENQDGQVGLATAQRLQNFLSRDIGKHEIEDDEVVGELDSEALAFVAVVSNINCVELLLQAIQYEVGDLLVVLDDEYAHAWISIFPDYPF